MNRGLIPTLRLVEFAISRSGRKQTTDLERQMALDTFERAYNVDINGLIDLEDLQIVGPNKASGVRYGATVPRIFSELINSLPIQHDQFTFIDFGSGKGAVLLYASEYSFKAILGIEFSAELHKIAEKNVARYRRPSLKCTSVVPLCMDAADYIIPDGPLVLYFNIPFGITVWEIVLDNLEIALRSTSTIGYLILLNYGWDREAAAFVNSRSFLRRIFENESYRIYEFSYSAPDPPVGSVER